MTERTFTLDEAQSLLPVLESLLRRAVDGKKLVETIDQEFQQLASKIFVNGGTLVPIFQFAQRKAQKEKALQAIKDSISEISAAGVQVKDLDMGLLDFPCVIEDRVILLCWKLGEASIAHWHGTDEGYAGRKALDESLLNPKKKPQQPN
jgi:hypothetical protein